MEKLNKSPNKEQVSFSFPFFLKKSLFILAIFCFLVLSSGCTDINHSDNKSGSVGVTKNINNSDNKAKLVEVTNLSQIDEALKKGPVVLKLGSRECIPCKQQEQVLSDLLPMYQDSATMMLIYVKEYPELAEEFGVRSIPDTCIITGIEHGKYMYMQQDGSKSPERATARFLGVADEKTLSETLDKAIASRK